jgi:hypothetical protein
MIIDSGVDRFTSLIYIHSGESFTILMSCWLINTNISFIPRRRTPYHPLSRSDGAPLQPTTNCTRRAPRRTIQPLRSPTFKVDAPASQCGQYSRAKQRRGALRSEKHRHKMADRTTAFCSDDAAAKCGACNSPICITARDNKIMKKINNGVRGDTVIRSP